LYRYQNTHSDTKRTNYKVRLVRAAELTQYDDWVTSEHVPKRKSQYVGMQI
jgi:hypothetical protein